MRGDQQLAFARVVAGGLFDVDVLAGLEPEHGHGRVPVVGRGDGDGVDLSGLESVAKIAFGSGRVAERLPSFRGEFGQDRGIDVADIRDASRLAVGPQRREMRVAAAVEADHGKVQAIVGAQNPGVAFGRGGKRRTRHARGQPANKVPSRNHSILHSIESGKHPPQQQIIPSFKWVCGNRHGQRALRNGKNRRTAISQQNTEFSGSLQPVCTYTGVGFGTKMDGGL